MNIKKHEKMFNPTSDEKTHIKTTWDTLGNTRLTKSYSGSEMWKHKNLQRWWERKLVHPLWKTACHYTVTIKDIHTLGPSSDGLFWVCNA